MEQIQDNIDILMISESKLDKSFPIGQFLMNGYSTPFRLDRNSHGGGILLYIREDIPAKLLLVEKDPIESFFVEINLRSKKKWLINCSYNPSKNSLSNHIEALSKSLDIYTSKYERLLFLGDFNAGMEDSSLKLFCSNYSLTSMINKPTCFKNPDNPSCIDLILTNSPRSFQNSCVIETGLSDFHKMVVTVMKTSFHKIEPKVINYRCYKGFSNDDFRISIQTQFEENIVGNCDKKFSNFINNCNSILDKQVPKKKKYVRGNQSPFMNKSLSKAIMLRTKLRNKFLKDRTTESKTNYVKQRNFCVSLLRKTKREYYGNLDEKKVCDNKTFWKVVKPMLSNKVKSNEKITLIENDEIVRNDKETAKVLNNFFSNIIKNLGIQQYNMNDPICENIQDPVLKAILRYRNHPSISSIKKVCNTQQHFSFTDVKKEDVIREIQNLNENKSVQSSDIPTKIIKVNSDIFGDFIFSNYNECKNSSIFPSLLKLANITPVHKKDSKNSKNNYRPVSILSNISKIYERLMFKQISEYFEQFFSKYQCGFRKGFSAQHCLVSMLEKWRSAIDNKKSFGALLTDLSKAFDCLSHDLLIAKLNAYGFSMSALRFVYSYLKNRKQRTKINSDYSSWEEILFGVPQGSILGPLLFNIFLCDLFLIMDNIDFASYADDNTPYTTGDSIEEVIQKLENASKALFQWFSDNQMKANPDKCHFLCSSKIDVSLSVENQNIQSSKCEKLLGVKLDSNLNFNSHIHEICQKAGQKLNAISRITPYMDFPKRRLLINAFFYSQFNYCQLVWMCHNRTNNNKINRLHERCLRLIYNDKKTTFDDLLKKDGSVSIHYKNLRTLAIELFKVYKGYSPVIFSETFPTKQKSQYNMRNHSYFAMPRAKTVNYGFECLPYIGSKLWDSLPTYMKDLDTIEKFKKALKSWKPEGCSCRICKVYVKNIGYL